MNILESLQALSNDFAEYVEETINSAGTLAPGDRVEAAAAASDLSFEHAFALRSLFEAGAPNSASAMLRLQYEALLRSAWLLYAATDAQVGRANLSNGEMNAAAAENIVGPAVMLENLERRAQEQPELRGLVVPLREIRAAAWAAMNAFVHGGLHPLARTAEGFPDAAAASLLKLSNSMLHMTARLSARLTGSPDVLRRVEQSGLKFANCLPVTKAPEA